MTASGRRTAGLRAVIDTSALTHNLARCRQAAPGCRVMAVIKANAYGHGIVPAAQALTAADAFAVARLEEALTLREAGIRQRIVLLEGVQDAEGLAVAAGHVLEPVVHQEPQIALLEAWRGKGQFTVWLKADTGMGRLGFGPSEFAAARERLDRCRSVRQPSQLMTHLAESEIRGNERTRAQLGLFERLTRGLAGERSVANSAGLIAWPEARADWIRPGIMLYGISPFPDSTGTDLDLRPVMRLESRILAIRSLAAGDRVGYGGAWTAAGPTRVAVVGAGYGDGYPRAAANGTPVRVDGAQASVVGRVSMDMLTIDVSALPRVAVGDPVELWGPGVPVETVAAASGTIGYELTCRVSRRVPFEYDTA